MSGLTQILTGAGVFGALAVVITGWWKYRSDSASTANANWGAMVQGYKEQVSFFAEQMAAMRKELDEVKAKYEREREALEKERDDYKELYLNSEKAAQTWKEKYDAKVLEIQTMKGDI